MSKTTKLGSVFAAALLATGLGCADPISAPARSGPPAANDLIGGLLGGVTSLLIPPVTRNTPLASDVVWSFTAGPAGAVSRNSAVGLTISIPANALSTTQTITVRALAGSPVAYAFEPHLTFARPVTLTQSLKGTSAGGLLSLPLLSGAHFDGDQLQLTSDGLAVVTETVPAVGNLLSQTASFNVSHFSGWILASGKCDDQ